VLTPNPSGNGALVDFQLFGSDLLRPEEGNEILKDGIHKAPPYGNSHIVEYGNTDLQGYGCTRNTHGMEFKDRLKAARKHAKLNQSELAILAGITQTSISDLERGKSKGTSFAAQIAAICNVSTMWLVTGKGKMLDESVAVDEFMSSRDRHDRNLLDLSDFTLTDHGNSQVERHAADLAMLASPRSQAALKRIVEAAGSGRLTEADVVLLEKIAERIAGKPVAIKEGANARIARKIKNAPKDSDRG
jgi:transcriptional regulator with XRE-family HTH domain